jgi:acyl-CoA reductase-like NAD-dependent aldehyde dehydrogenase
MKMPVLAKAKKEIYAQELANGTDVQKAYVKAGYKPGKGNAYTMKNSREIQNRVAEILSARNRKLLEKSAQEVEITREKILGELEEARQIAKKARNGSAMAMASLGKAKVQGLIVDRREVGVIGSFDGKTDEELMEEAKRRAEALGIIPPKLDS